MELRQHLCRNQFPHQLRKVLLDAGDYDLNFGMQRVVTKRCYHQFAKLKEEKRLVAVHLLVIHSLFLDVFHFNKFADFGMLLRPVLFRYSLLS